MPITQARNIMKNKEPHHRHLLHGEVSCNVMNCLHRAAPRYMTHVEIAEATGLGAKAVAWALFLLRRNQLTKGRFRGTTLEYRAVSPRLRQGWDRTAAHENACGARTRSGSPCKLRSIYSNGRCKFHGGLSTGPKTDAGKEQARINGRKGGRPRKQAANPTS